MVAIYMYNIHLEELFGKLDMHAVNLSDHAAERMLDRIWTLLVSVPDVLNVSVT